MHLLLYHHTEMYLYSWSRSDRRLGWRALFRCCAVASTRSLLVVWILVAAFPREIIVLSGGLVFWWSLSLALGNAARPHAREGRRIASRRFARPTSRLAFASRVFSWSRLFAKKGTNRRVDVRFDFFPSRRARARRRRAPRRAARSSRRVRLDDVVPRRRRVRGRAQRRRTPRRVPSHAVQPRPAAVSAQAHRRVRPVRRAPGQVQDARRRLRARERPTLRVQRQGRARPPRPGRQVRLDGPRASDDHSADADDAPSQHRSRRRKRIPSFPVARHRPGFRPDTSPCHAELLTAGPSPARVAANTSPTPRNSGRVTSPPWSACRW